MQKRVWALLLALIMMLSLAACGAKDDDDDDDERDSKSLEEILAPERSREIVDPDTFDEDAVRFLCWFGWHSWDAAEYDSENISIDTGVLNDWFTHAVPFDEYPGPDCQDFVDGDPRGRFDSCSIYDAEKTDWILKNIFHYTQQDIEAAREAAEQDELPYYYEDGSYYISVGGVGGGYEVRPVYVETDGSKYYITYASYSGDGVIEYDGLWYAEMGHEEIDGETYWTLYKWSQSVPEPEKAPNDRLLRACEGDWLLDDGISQLQITNVTDGTCTVQAGFYRMCAFTANARLQSDGRTLVYEDTERNGFCGRITLDKDALTLRGYACPEDYNGGTMYDFFEDSIFRYTPDSSSTAEASEGLFAEPEGADVRAWVGTWVANDGEIIEVTEATEDYVKLTYSGYDASGSNMYRTDYTLSYTDETKNVCAEDESVIASSGYRLVFTLSDGVITLSSRYPDKDFYRQ